MESSAVYKEQMIREYILNIDFKSPFSVSKMKEDLKKIIKETPGVNLEYKRDSMVTEDKNSGEKKIVNQDNVKSVTIAFSDGSYENGVPKVHKVTYFI